MAHGDPTTFNRLVELLSPAKIVVHVDAKSSTEGYSKRNVLAYVDERVRVNWGGFSQVEATKLAYEGALQHADDESEHIVLLSGQCIPIRPLSELEHFLATSQWRQHCRAGGLLDGNARNEDRVRRKWLFDKFPARARPPVSQYNGVVRRMYRHLSPTLPVSSFQDLNVVAGSQWTALTADCLVDVMSRSRLVEDCNRLFAHAMAPDEIYFHTLVHSTEWGAQTATPSPTGKGDLRTADFANLHFIYRSLTQYIEMGDLDKLTASGAFFSRKADLARDPELGNAIARLINTPLAGGSHDL